MRYALIACVLVLTALAFFAAIINVDAKAASLANQEIGPTTSDLRADFDAEKTRLQTNITTLTDENVEQRVALETNASTKSKMAQDLAEAFGQVETLRAAAEVTRGEHASVAKQLTEAMAEIASIKTAASSKADEIGELKAELLAVGSENAALKQSLSKADIKISDLTQTVQAGDDVKSALKNELAGLKAEAGISRELHSTFEAADTKAHLQAQIAASEISTLQRSSREKDDALSASEGRIASLVEALENERQKGLELNNRVVEFKTQIATLKSEVTTAVVAASSLEVISTENVATYSAAVLDAITQCNEKTSKVFAEQQITFATDTDALSSSSIPQLEHLASVAIDCGASDLILTITGNVESDSTLNSQLGRDRAHAIRNFLGARGFSRSAMRAVGYDEADGENTASTDMITFDWQPN